MADESPPPPPISVGKLRTSLLDLGSLGKSRARPYLLIEKSTVVALADLAAAAVAKREAGILAAKRRRQWADAHAADTRADDAGIVAVALGDAALAEADRAVLAYAEVSRAYDAALERFAP